eukprot:318969-Prymnesium_polylepis.1
MTLTQSGCCPTTSRPNRPAHSHPLRVSRPVPVQRGRALASSSGRQTQRLAARPSPLGSERRTILT